MTKKKYPNPIMTPEWIEALMSQPAQPAEEAFLEYHRKRRAEEAAVESTAPPPPEDWYHDPVLLAVSVLLQSLGRGNYEQARQETQTINRCLATGASPDPSLLSCMLRDLIG